MRDHDPILIEEFNGLFSRGGVDSVPNDHFSDCNNIQFVQSGFKTRNGFIQNFSLTGYQSQVYRTHNFNDGFLVLTKKPNTVADWFDITYYDKNWMISKTAIETINAWDFNCVTIGSFAYITLLDKNKLPLKNQPIYVFSPSFNVLANTATFFGYARPIAGSAPSNGKTFQSFYAIQTNDPGSITEGFRIFAIVYGNASNEYSFMSETAIVPIYSTASGTIRLNNIPIGPAGVTQRLILVTSPITDLYNGNPFFYTYNLLTTINDNTITMLDLDYSEGSLTTAPTLGIGVDPPSAPSNDNQFYAKNDIVDGDSDLGLRAYAVCYETNTGFITPPGPEVKTLLFSSGNKKIKFENIPSVAPNGYEGIVARRLICTKALQFPIPSDLSTLKFYFIPNGRINDSNSTEFTVEFFDADLVNDASYLFEILDSVPACRNLTTFHNRLVLVNEFNVQLSNVVDYETINQIDNQLSIPNDNILMTTAQEYRDTLYVFKEKKTIAFSDNSSTPNTWGFVETDQGLGSSIHGIIVVFTNDRISIEFLFISNQDGLWQFNGVFAKPELSWKIRDYWLKNCKNVSGVNHTNKQTLFFIDDNERMLIADYANGLTAETIRWAPWSIDGAARSFLLTNDNQLILGIGPTNARR